MHILVAAYLGYKAPVQTSAPEAQADGDDPGPIPAWLSGMGSLPAPAAAQSAANPEEAVQAFEKLFFGEVKDVEQL